MELDWARGNAILLDGMEVAHANREWIRERAVVQIGPELWTFRAERWGGRTLLAELDGTPRFTARRSGFLTATWTIDVGRLVELTQAGVFTSRMRISRNGTAIGEAAPSGILTSRPRLSLTEALDVRAGCFLLWVVFVELNRRSSD